MDKDTQIEELRQTVDRLSGKVHALETILEVLFHHLPPNVRQPCSEVLDSDAGWIGAEGVSPAQFAALKFTILRVFGRRSGLAGDAGSTAGAEDRLPISPRR